MNVDLQNSEQVNDVPNLTVIGVGVKSYPQSQDYLIEQYRLPMGEDLRDTYSFDGGDNGYSNIKGATKEEQAACGKRPLWTNTVKGHAWGRCVSDFHSGAGIATAPEINSVCGKRPFFTGARRNKWNKCKSDLMGAAKTKVNEARAQQQADAEAADRAAKKAIDDARIAKEKAEKLKAIQRDLAIAEAQARIRASQQAMPQYMPPQEKSNTTRNVLIAVGALVAIIGGALVIKRLRAGNAQ